MFIFASLGVDKEIFLFWKKKILRKQVGVGDKTKTVSVEETQEESPTNSDGIVFDERKE